MRIQIDLRIEERRAQSVKFTDLAELRKLMREVAGLVS
jgi:hypothetical protein